MILDSNVIIYSVQPDYETLLVYLEQNKSRLQVSLITQPEVLGFYQLKPDDKADFENFFASIHALPLNEAIINEAIHLRQQRKRSLGDSIIAATALLYNQPVLTNIVTDFADIDGLQVIALTDVLNA